MPAFVPGLSHLIWPVPVNVRPRIVEHVTCPLPASLKAKLPPVVPDMPTPEQPSIRPGLVALLTLPPVKLRTD